MWSQLAGSNGNLADHRLLWGRCPVPLSLPHPYYCLRVTGTADHPTQWRLFSVCFCFTSSVVIQQTVRQPGPPGKDVYQTKCTRGNINLLLFYKTRSRVGQFFASCWFRIRARMNKCTTCYRPFSAASPEAWPTGRQTDGRTWSAKDLRGLTAKFAVFSPGKTQLLSILSSKWKELFAFFFSRVRNSPRLATATLQFGGRDFC